MRYFPIFKDVSSQVRRGLRHFHCWAKWSDYSNPIMWLVRIPGSSHGLRNETCMRLKWLSEIFRFAPERPGNDDETYFSFLFLQAISEISQISRFIYLAHPHASPAVELQRLSSSKPGQDTHAP